MHLNAKRPIFVPDEFFAEIDKMSKAALMDLAWDFATTATTEAQNDAEVMKTFRERAAVILHHRSAA